jgi:hypothetical protein
MGSDGADLGFRYDIYISPFLESEITSIGCDRLAAIIFVILDITVHD